RGIRRIPSRVEFGPEPAEPRADRLAEARLAFSDPCGEDECGEPAHRHRQPAALAWYPEREEIDRLACLRAVAREQFAAVGLEAGYAQQAAAMVENILDVTEALAAGTEQMQQHAGIDRTAAGRHRDTVERGEAH